MIVGVNLPALVAILDQPLGAIGVVGGDRIAHLIHADAEAIQHGGVELHAHCRQRATANRHLADPGNLRQFLRDDGRGRIVHLPARQRFRSQRQDHHRCIGGIDLAIGRVGRQAGRQVGARRLDCRLYIARRAVNLATQFKLQGDIGAAQRGLRSDLGDAGNAPQRALQWRGHRRRHHLRAGARQAGRYRDGRKIHLRQRRHRQLLERHRTGQGNADGQQGGRHRTAYEQLGKTHYVTIGIVSAVGIVGVSASVWQRALDLYLTVYPRPSRQALVAR